MSAGRIVDAVISSSSTSPGSATIRTTPRAKIRTVAGTGVRVRGLTCRISRRAGKRPSRAIAKTRRAHAAIATTPAPKNANVIATSSTRSMTGPSWSRMMAATGEPLAEIRVMSLIATVSAIRNSTPRTEAATTDPTIARGTAWKEPSVRFSSWR